MPRIFRGIFLAAPDIVNESLEPGPFGEPISDSAARVVVYNAYDDLALRGSKIVNMNEVVSRRLGHTGPQKMSKVAEHVYSLDCGAFNNKWDTTVGHSYQTYDDKTGKKPSPLIIHALEVMDDLMVPVANELTRKGRLKV